jgi:capsular exopolysaccharide synthesis family protein
MAHNDLIRRDNYVAPVPESLDAMAAREATNTGRQIRPSLPVAEPATLSERKGSGTEIDAWTLLLSLRRRWALALGLAVGLSAMTALVAKLALPPPTYTVRTLLYVAANRPIVLFDTPEGRTEFANNQKNQLAMVKGRPVLRSALANKEVASLSIIHGQANPLTWLESNITADYSVAPEILRIALTGNQPDELEILVNAVRDAYLQKLIDSDHNGLFAKLERLRQLHRDEEEKLATKRVALRVKAEALGSREPEILVSRQQAAVRQLIEQQDEAFQLHNKLASCRREVAQKTQDGPPPPDSNTLEAAAESAVFTAPRVSRQADEVRRLEFELQRLQLSGLGPSHPAIRTQIEVVAIAQRVLAADREDARRVAREQASQKHRQDWLERLTQQRKQIEDGENQLQFVQGEIARHKQEIDTLAPRIVELQDLRAEFARQADLVKMATDRARNLEIEMSAPARAYLIDEAVVSQTPGLNRLLKWVVLPSLAVFLGVLFGVAWLEARIGRVNRAHDVAERLGIKLAGLLPEEPNWTRHCLAGVGVDGQGDFTDAVDRTCAMLLHSTGSAGPLIVLATSALGGEGKSALSCHLALGYARAGYKTLLIDGDFRSPSLHRLFGLAARPGFGDLLRGNADLGMVAQSGPIAGLTIIANGQCPLQTIKSFDWMRLPGLFRRLKSEFQIIVIDTAPVLPVPDTLHLAEHADAAVLAVRRDVSRLPTVREATVRLSAYSCHLLGAVVSGECGVSYGAYRSAVSGLDGGEHSHPSMPDAGAPVRNGVNAS